MEFVNDDGIRVLGKEEDNLRFISKVTSYTVSTYNYMKYLTFTVTSTEFPIVYLYIPYDDVGTCSNASYTDHTTCKANSATWSWTSTDEINMGAVHNIYNTTGNTWEVTVIGARMGYPKNAEIYVFNTVDSTASTDTYGFRTYKADGTTLAFDSGFTPLMSRWGAEFTTLSGGTYGYSAKTFSTGDWSTRSVSKPAFNCSMNNISFHQWNSYFCFDGDMYWYMHYYRMYYSSVTDGVAIWNTASGRGSPTNINPDYVETNNSCDRSTSAFSSTPDTWYYRLKTLPFIDGAKYD